MKTFRDLVAQAFRESGVLGLDGIMEAEELGEAIRTLNLILDDIYSLNIQMTTTADAVVFDGKSDYVLGTDASDPEVDIVVKHIPEQIDSITYILGNTRYPVKPIPADMYYDRLQDTQNTNIPEFFYYDRIAQYPVIRFYESAPSSNGELIYKPSLTDVGPNDLLPEKLHRSLKSYLVYELASRIASQNQMDPKANKVQSNKSWNAYRRSTQPVTKNVYDASSPSISSGRYDIYSNGFRASRGSHGQI